VPLVVPDFAVFLNTDASNMVLLVLKLHAGSFLTSVELHVISMVIYHHVSHNLLVIFVRH